MWGWLYWDFRVVHVIYIHPDIGASLQQKNVLKKTADSTYSMMVERKFTSLNSFTIMITITMYITEAFM